MRKEKGMMTRRMDLTERNGEDLSRFQAFAIRGGEIWKIGARERKRGRRKRGVAFLQLSTFRKNNFLKIFYLFCL